MGYETRYSLIVSPTDRYDEVKAAIEQISEYGDYIFDERLTWYDHEEHCSEVSHQFPDVWIIIDGTGEEIFDKWRKTFRNGKKTDEWRAEEQSPPNNVRDGEDFCFVV